MRARQAPRNDGDDLAAFATTLREVAEADVGKSVVVVYRAVGAGRVRIAYGLTRGETRHAYASLTFVVTVTAP